MPPPRRPVAIDLQDCNWYAQSYCEENVYRLAKVLCELSPGVSFDVVFLSNKHRKMPIWSQRSSTSQDSPVIWDYHVLIVLKTVLANQSTSYVYDMDSTLPFPCIFEEFIEKAMRPAQLANLPAQYHRMFRVVDGQIYLDNFASDRSHMKKEDGAWMQEPPTWNPIQTATSTMNLPEYVDMTHKTDDPIFGRVYAEPEFLARYSHQLVISE